MPDPFGEPVVTLLACFFISHARLRVHRAPGIPCALSAQTPCVCRDQKGEQRKTSCGHPAGTRSRAREREALAFGTARCLTFEFIRDATRITTTAFRHDGAGRLVTALKMDRNLAGHPRFARVQRWR